MFFHPLYPPSPPSLWSMFPLALALALALPRPSISTTGCATSSTSAVVVVDVTTSKNIAQDNNLANWKANKKTNKNYFFWVGRARHFVLKVWKNTPSFLLACSRSLCSHLTFYGWVQNHGGRSIPDSNGAIFISTPSPSPPSSSHLKNGWFSSSSSSSSFFFLILFCWKSGSQRAVFGAKKKRRRRTGVTNKSPPKRSHHQSNSNCSFQVMLNSLSRITTFFYITLVFRW